jgi:hemin uptake protein HemP
MEIPKREDPCLIKSDLTQFGERSHIDSHSASIPLGAQRVLDSADLLRGAREVQIRHEEKIYRLQVTRNGKLILIK